MMDASEFYKQLASQFQDSKPFVVYRKPGDDKIQALLQRSKESVRIKNLDTSGFVFAAFNSEADPFLIPEENSEKMMIDTDQRSDLISLDGENVAGVDFEYMEEDQKAHEKLVQKAIDSIKRGGMKKVVLSRSEKVQVHDPDPFRIVKKLFYKYPKAFVYLWFHPETGSWLGATPETLIRVDHKRFQTMALAGTQLYKENEDAEWGQKEVEEQLLVTDYILESLEKQSGVENLKATSPYTARAGNLLHICTDITGRLKDNSKLTNLVKALHPTPAVCGLPKEKALRFIIENEGYSREYYTGFLGELNLKTVSRRNSDRKNQENQQFMSISEKTDLYVNLRCMKLKDGNARIYVGGGITSDSNAADEWVETVNKAQTMKSALVK